MIRAVALATAFAWALPAGRAQDKPADGRLPVPEAAAVRDAEKLIRDLFKDEYAKKGPSDKLALSKKLLLQGSELKDDAASRYVLLRQAADLAAEAGDVASSLQALEELAKHYLVEPVKLKTAALATAAKVAKSPEEAAALAAQYLRLAAEALLVDDFDSAAKAVDAGSTLAKKAKDLALSGRLQVKGKEVSDLRGKFEKVAKARATLAARADDAPSNLLVGQYECFTKGNWPVGLPFLATSPDGLLKDLASKDLAEPSDASQQAAVGDGWWDLSDKEAVPAVKDRLRQRAHIWYQKAAPGMSGLGKAKVDKRVKALLLDRINRGSWVDVSDPKLFGKSGKPGDPVELTGLDATEALKMPTGEFDGVSLRVRIKGQNGLPIFAFENKTYAAWIDLSARRLVIGRLDRAKNQWIPDHQLEIEVDEEYLLAILISEGAYLVFLNGEERIRLTTTQQKHFGIILECSQGVVMFDQTRLRKRE